MDIWAAPHGEVTAQKLMKALQSTHVAHGWYDTSLVELTPLLADALVAAYQTGDVGANDDEVEAIIDIGDILEVCEPKQAPSAPEVRR